MRPGLDAGDRVLCDPTEDCYKGWYCAYRHQPGVETGSSHSTLYVQSPDGITWHQPDLGLFPEAEPRENRHRCQDPYQEF